MAQRPTMIAGGAGASTLYNAPSASKHRSGRYNNNDSMMYHGSMFLKRLSHIHDGDQKDHKHEGWRVKLGHFLESKPEQIFIFCLIILDLLIIFTQLFVIEPHYCHRDVPIQPNTTQPTVHPTTHPTTPPHYVSWYNSNPTDHPEHHSSEEHEPHDPYEIAEEVLAWASLSILCTLGLEIVLLLIAFDVDFFKQPLYILDALVIGASLAIELSEKTLTGSLLMIFRLWRIVRIIHGVAMSVQEKNEEEIKELEAEVEKLTKEKAHVDTKFDYLKKKYRKLVEAHEAIHDANSNIPAEGLLLGNTPRPESLFNSPGAPNDNNSNNTPNVKSTIPPKRIRIRTTDISDSDYSDEDDDDDGTSPQTSSRAITINDDNDNNTRQPLVGRVLPNNEYNTFKNGRQ